MSLTLFLGMYFAAYRVSRLVISDTLFDRYREMFYRRYPPTRDYAAMRPVTMESGFKYWKHESAPWRPVSKWGQLFACYWCIGFWISGLVVVTVANWTSVQLPVLWWLAVSSAVGLTARNLDA